MLRSERHIHARYGTSVASLSLRRLGRLQRPWVLVGVLEGYIRSAARYVTCSALLSATSLLLIRVIPRPINTDSLPKHKTRTGNGMPVLWPVFRISLAFSDPVRDSDC